MGRLRKNDFSALVLKRYGCKYPLLAFCLTYILGFVLIGVATHPLMVYTGRTVTGIAVGGSSLIGKAVRTLFASYIHEIGSAFVYVGEFADSHRRGKLGGFIITLLAIGITYIMTIGIFVTWQVASVCCLIPQLVGLLLLLYVPDSPFFLVHQGKEVEAKKALLWFQGGDVDNVERKMTEIQEYLSHLDKEMTLKSFLCGTKPVKEDVEEEQEGLTGKVSKDTDGGVTLKIVGIIMVIFLMGRLCGE